VRVILTEDVLYPTIEVIGREKVSRALEKDFELYTVRHNPKIGVFVVTDRSMGLVPYRLDGMFDWSSDLISCNDRAIEWGRALFNHYVEIAESVDVSTYDATLDPPKSDDAFEQVV
jgi:predicted transcriptional regulator